MILHCNGKMDEMIAVAAAAPQLAGDAARRAAAALAQRKPAAPIEVVGRRAEFFKLMAGVEPAAGSA
jgi:beta-N-acetylhexosaminidase